MTGGILLLASSAAFLAGPAKLPVEFQYDGRAYGGLAGCAVVENVASPSGGVYRVRVAPELDVRVVWRHDATYDETEYTVWFENNGDATSKVLRNPWAFAGAFRGERPLLRGILGDHVNKYAAYEHDLSKADRYFFNISGRATHVDFPYFDLVHGDGGTLIAIGWAGTWEAVFSSVGGETSVRARTDYNWRMQLLPGEKVRTGLVVLMDYAGRDQDAAMNKWRRWFIERNMPRANAKGDPIEPFSTVYFAYDTGLPNSDGSISERHFTWKPTLDKLVAERIVADFRWFDAGWYCDTDGNSVPSDWWGRIGTWEIDSSKWPGKTLKESNDACRKAGMRGAYCWFEPERTASANHLDGLVKNYGYKREWACVNPNNTSHVVNNLGLESCFQWILGRIVSTMEKGGFDLYREDFNTDPEPAWWMVDKRDTDARGIERWGMAENMIVQGHYRLWDEIIAHCARSGKFTFIDSCASGGGRNDIESMRRAIPFFRSDADRTKTSLRFGMTTSLCRWIPFNGCICKETERELSPSSGAGADIYTARASMLPILHIQEAFTHNRNLDYSLMRRNIAEWKSVCRLLVKDFYPLTPWHHESELRDWAVFAYDWPEKGEAAVFAFRMEKCEIPVFVARLKFADPAAEYEITDADTGATVRKSGAALRDGLEIRLEKPRSSALLRICQKEKKP